jgi:hypothetical protein
VVPGQSVTLFILAAAKSFALAAGPVREDGNISVTLNGQMGQTYVLQVSTNNNNWVSLSTNIMGSSPTNFLFPAGYQKAFFRAKQL